MTTNNVTEEIVSLRAVKGMLASSEVCLHINPMVKTMGLALFCDRKFKHTGKHMHRDSLGRRSEWWGPK